MYVYVGYIGVCVGFKGVGMVGAVRVVRMWSGMVKLFLGVKLDQGAKLYQGAVGCISIILS